MKKHAFEKEKEACMWMKMQSLGDVVGTILFHQRIKIWASYVHELKNRDKDLEVIPYVSYLLLCITGYPKTYQLVKIRFFLILQILWTRNPT